jgi:hypothetical protein
VKRKTEAQREAEQFAKMMEEIEARRPPLAEREASYRRLFMQASDDEVDRQHFPKSGRAH